MKFLLTISLLFAVCKAQIIPDGRDNTEAFNTAAQSGMIWLPTGTVKCKSIAFSGDTFATAKELLSLQTKFRRGFQFAKYRKPLIIKGSPGSVIELSDSAALYLMGQGRNTDFTSTEISDVTIRGKGSGIVAAYIFRLRLNNVTFEGFEDALLLNNCYSFHFNDLQFFNCKRAAYILQSHGGLINNTWLNGCDTGFVLLSNNLVFNAYIANYCGVGLIIRAGNNEFHSASFESNKPAEAQMIIGNDAGALISGNLFSTLLIAANPNSKSGIWFKKTAGNFYIQGDNSVFIKPRIDSGSNYKIIKS